MSKCCKNLPDIDFVEALSELSNLKNDIKAFHKKIFEYWANFEKYSKKSREYLDSIISIILNDKLIELQKI